MKTITTAIAVIISVSAISYSVAAAGLSVTASIDRAEDDAAIRKIASRLQDGWNKGDGKAFAAPFAEDADYVVVNGMRIKGRDTIAAGHQRIFDTVYKDSHNTATVQSVRFIRDDVAVAHIEWHLKFRENAVEREGKAMCSMVMTKKNGEWSIIAFHNTPIASAQK